MKTLLDLNKKRVKALQRFRKGTAPWGIYDGHLFALNPDKTAVMFARPRPHGFPRTFVNFDPWTNLDGAFTLDLDTCEFTDAEGEPVPVETKEHTSRALDAYLYPGKASDTGRVQPESQVVMVETLKLAAQTFEDFGVSSVAVEYHGAFQWWCGNTRDNEVCIVTMGGRRKK